MRLSTNISPCQQVLAKEQNNLKVVLPHHFHKIVATTCLAQVYMGAGLSSDVLRCAEMLDVCRIG